jgi:hypothetical protein
MGYPDSIAQDQPVQQSTESLDDLLIRLRQVRRRLERWVPSSESIALWTSDYTEVFGAAQRLEAAVSELDSRLEVCHGDPEESRMCLRTWLEKLERSACDFERSILRNAAVA